MPTRDPNTRQAALRLAMSRAKARAVVRSRRIDRASVLVLAGLGAAAALALVLVPTAGEAKFGSWTCYNLKENPQGVVQQQGGQPSLEVLPQGHQIGQVYSHAVVAPPQPVPSQSNTSGLGVVIDGVWYPEPDVSRYFYYVEIPGEGPAYCQPTAAVQGQADGGQTYGSHRTSGVVRGSVPVVQQAPLDQQVPAELGTMQAVPFGYAGAPGTLFQPVAGNP